MILHRDDVFEAVRWLRWPLMAGMMFSHVFGSHLAFYMQTNAVPYWFVLMVGWLAQPLSHACMLSFFLIAGWLFFRGAGASPWSWKAYGGKLRRRLWTVVLPYVVWNLVFVAEALFCRSSWGKALFPGRPSVEISWQWFLQSFWDAAPQAAETAMPLDYPLWFLRVLLLLCLLAPGFYFVVKKTGAFLPLAFAFVAVAGWWPGWAAKIAEPQCAAMFAAGAWAALSPRRARRLASARAAAVFWTVFVILGAMWVCGIVTLQTETALTMVTVYVVLWTGCTAALRWRVPMPEVLADSAFVLFASHLLFLRPWASLLYRVPGIRTPAGMALFVFAVVLGTCAACAAFDAALRRWLPRLHRLLSGGR